MLCKKICFKYGIIDIKHHEQQIKSCFIDSCAVHGAEMWTTKTKTCRKLLTATIYSVCTKLKIINCFTDCYQVCYWKLPIYFLFRAIKRCTDYLTVNKSTGLQLDWFDQWSADQGTQFFLNQWTYHGHTKL